MDNDRDTVQKTYKHETYEFRIHGHISRRVARLFEGMTISPLEDGTTLIFGPLPDQTALHSILIRIRDLNIKLISVNLVIGKCGSESEHSQEAF